MKYNLHTGYGAWGGLNFLRSLNTGLENLTQKNVKSFKLSGHDGEEFTEQMGGWTLRDYEEDIRPQLVVENVVIVAHSMLAVCAFNLAQRFPGQIKGVVMIDPPMLGGISDWRVSQTFLRHPVRYLWPLLAKKALIPTRKDAQMMLFNGAASPHLDSITKQPASGRAIRQMVTSWLPKETNVPCALIIANGSRLHSSTPKKIWAEATRSPYWTLDDSHCGILENPRLPHIVNEAVKQITQS